ncbi:hypothetical protein RB195_025266 [Necator americanus]|uniref:Uncharacterized protein n=1 Tax=Necator americanus TaxID=51031 RepID=A0ABR1ERL9_NECAM
MRVIASGDDISSRIRLVKCIKGYDFPPSFWQHTDCALKKFLVLLRESKNRSIFGFFVRGEVLFDQGMTHRPERVIVERYLMNTAGGTGHLIEAPLKFP